METSVPPDRIVKGGTVCCIATRKDSVSSIRSSSDITSSKSKQMVSSDAGGSIVTVTNSLLKSSDSAHDLHYVI